MSLALLWLGIVGIQGIGGSGDGGGHTVTTLPSCCPPGWTLTKISAGLFRAGRYECLPSNSTELHELLFERDERLLGYGIGESESGESNNSAIPQCSRPALMRFSGEKDVEIPSRSCLVNGADGADGADGGGTQIAAISCPLEHNDRLQRLSFVSKCCPSGHIYKASERQCVPTGQPADYSAYGFLFQHYALFTANAIVCPRSKVLVEYRLPAHSFAFDDGQVILRESGKRFHYHEYCMEAIVAVAASDGRPAQFLVRTCDDVSICRQLACVRRCCSDGEMFSKGNATSYCKRDASDMPFHSFESLQISGNFSKPSTFGILRSLDCLKYRLDPDSYADEAHTISQHDGSLVVMATQKHYTNQQYCVEKIHNSTWTDQKLYTFLCFDTKVVGNDRIRFRVYTAGLLISCSFYAITLLVYLVIAKLRNLPGQILICLVSSLFTAYLGIALGQLMPTPNDDICFASGFFIYFCLMAAFSWMNVMCFDIWQTFGSAKKTHGLQEGQRKRFALYSLYGWGLPTLITAITVSLTKSGLLSEQLRPNFGHGRCWFTYEAAGAANLLFFSGPVGVLFLINFVLFILTLRYCNRVKQEIFRMQSSNMEKPALRRRFFMDKARFVMNTKLFVVMGITWFLELLSIIFYDHKKIFFWAVSDSFNVLLGVFVFFIFVFKRRVWNAILEKLGIRSKDHLKSTPTPTCASHSMYTPNASITQLHAVDLNPSALGRHPAKRLPTI